MAEASVAVTASAKPALRVGRTLQRSFAILMRNFVPFMILSVLTTVPDLVFVLLEGDRKPTPGQIAVIIAGGILSFILALLLQPILLYGSFQDMRGRPVRLSESARQGLARFFPILGTAILATFAAGLGMLLLIVPGMILMLMYSVAQPVCVVERLGPAASLRRSAELTKGYRWTIFGVLILVGIINAILTNGGSFLFLWLFGPLVTSILLFVISAADTAFNAILFVVIYHDLRVLKEGIDIEKIAAVFD